MMMAMPLAMALWQRATKKQAQTKRLHPVAQAPGLLQGLALAPEAAPS